MGVFSGVIVGTIFLVGYLFQLYKILKEEDLSGLSLMFFLFISMSTTITSSNLHEADVVWYVLYPQYINFSVALLIFCIVIVKKEGWLTLWNIAWAFSFSMYVFIHYAPNELIQHGATFGIALAYIGQILYTITTKNVKGISPILFIAFGVGLMIMTINIVITGAPIYTAYTEITNICMIIIMLILFKKYKKND